MDDEQSVNDAPQRSAFVPILLPALALTCWLAFQTLQLVREQRQLDAVQSGLLVQEQAAKKVRTALDEVATATAKLAGEGNANARSIVEQLRSRGITINPSGATKPP